MQPFQMRAEVQVVPLNVERLRLADGVPRGGQYLGKRLPVVGIKVLDRASCQLVAEMSAGCVGAPPQDVSSDARRRAVEAIPAPALLRLIFDKWPEFINLQVFDAWWHSRFTNLGSALADGLHHAHRADGAIASQLPYVRSDFNESSQSLSANSRRFALARCNYQAATQHQKVPL